MHSSSQAFVMEVAKKWDNVAVAPDVDWFSEDLAPSTDVERRGMTSHFSAPVKHTFEFSCPLETAVNLQMKYNAITKVFNFNDGEPIGANDGNQYSVILHSGMSYNIQHKTATQACSVIITESFNVDL
ncbi:MAG: hypothetical protein NPINA01_18040 [Nitrospinaceae bacterium]|nr:MAG: hypothetical protein NPINA01_18040 [Nitrospinaceae bacterium]